MAVVVFGVVLVVAFGGGEVLESELRPLRFHEFESFHEVLIRPLFFLELPNPASYQKLASSSPAPENGEDQANCLNPKNHSRTTSDPCSSGEQSQDSRSPPHIEPKSEQKSTHTFHRFSNPSEQFTPDHSRSQA
mgnify:CR=1 FL=1